METLKLYKSRQTSRDNYLDYKNCGDLESIPQFIVIILTIQLNKPVAE